MTDLLNVFYAQVTDLVPKICAGALICLGFWAVGRFLTGLFLRSVHRTRLDPMVVTLLAKSVQITVVVFGVITALGTLGVNITAMLTSLGLTGFCLGIAMKDALSNLFAGVMILLYRPFRVGQRISMSGLDGKVVDIDLRYTTLDSEGTHVLIPNSNILTNSIIIRKEAKRVPAFEAPVRQ